MKLNPIGEPRVRMARVSELVQRPPELGPYAEALSLVNKIREKIKADFDNPDLWYPGTLSTWSDVKWIDPGFDVPEISSEQIKEKLFTYIESSEKHFGEGVEGVNIFKSKCWILESASKAITLRPELQAEVLQRVQLHIDIVLDRLEEMEYPTDFDDARGIESILIRLQAFGPEVRERLNPLIKKFESSAVDLLKQMAEKELSTEQERAELFVSAVLLRLTHPDRQTEIQGIALPKVGDFDAASVDVSERFIILLFRLLLHSPKITLLPSGSIEMTLPPEAVTPRKPMPDRSTV